MEEPTCKVIEGSAPCASKTLIASTLPDLEQLKNTILLGATAWQRVRGHIQRSQALFENVPSQFQTLETKTEKISKMKTSQDSCVSITFCISNP